MTDYPTLTSYENHRCFVSQVLIFDRYARLALHKHYSSRSAVARNLPLLRIRTVIPCPDSYLEIESMFVEARREDDGSLIDASDALSVGRTRTFAKFRVLCDCALRGQCSRNHLPTPRHHSGFRVFCSVRLLHSRCTMFWAQK